MSVKRIDALCACDGCDKRFGVELELAQELKGGDYEDFEALVRDTIRGGQAAYYTWTVRAKQTVDRTSLTGFPSIQAGLLLCDNCTRRCDDLTDEDGKEIERDLDRAEVNRALGLPEDTE